ncbi:regulator of G-protein signaling [Acrasis kona]|uniref:Regulator of G-protein signaling n=1 Tax=Acrasis kona TaxID=1008807 RepID=A0AAW2ZH85_9EUKA
MTSLTGYCFTFEAVFSDDVLCDHFVVYLKRSFNEDCLLFLKDCKVFSSIGKADELQTVAKSICDRYIKQGGSNEINISGAVRNYLCSVIDGQSEHKLSSSIFDDLSFVVTRELKEDAFARYIRSKDFEDFVKKRGNLFLSKYKVGKRAELVLPTYASDFTTKCISDEDVKLVLKLCEDSPIWDALRQTKMDEKERTAYSYISHKPLKTSIGEKVILAKFVGSLPYSAERTIHAMMSVDGRRKYWDRGQTGNKFIDIHTFEKQDEHAVSLSFYKHTIGIPIFKDAECNLMNSIVYDTKRQCYMWIMKSTSGYGRHKDAVRSQQLKFNYSTVVNHVSDNSCRFTVILLYFMSRLDSASIIKLGLKPVASDVQDGMMKLLENMEDNGIIIDEHRMKDTLNDYLKKTNGGKTWDTSDVKL